MVLKSNEKKGEAAPMLVYIDDSLPGITRRRKGKAWAYFSPEGERITDREEIDRLNRIALPPAYVDAWFCPSPTGHIQATGYDEKGRKQYRYHDDFRSQQEAEKYDRCASFGRALPLLRQRIESDLAQHGLGKERAVAALVRLLDLGRVRVGNSRYARLNKSFGATTLRHSHAKVRGGTLKLRYKAKSGKMRDVAITDRSLAQFVKKVQDLPGQQLFQYLGVDGELHPVSSSDVNSYIHEAMGADFSAKHFRTWGASVLAFEALALAKKPLTLNAMVEPVAAALGNTPAISRKSYIHPELINLCKDGQEEWRTDLRLPRKTRYLSRAERGLIVFLDECDACAAGIARAA